jgi:hypothetical protein
MGQMEITVLLHLLKKLQLLFRTTFLLQSFKVLHKCTEAAEKLNNQALQQFKYI